MYNFKSPKTRKEMCDIMLYFSFLSLDFKVQAMHKGTEQLGKNILMQLFSMIRYFVRLYNPLLCCLDEPT